MLERLVHGIIKTGKVHKWLRYLCVLALVMVFGCAALMERAAKMCGWVKAAAIELRNNYLEQRKRRQNTSPTRPFVSARRPAARVMALALSICMVLALMPMTAFAAELDSDPTPGVSGVCTHHTHDDTCGYAEAKEGQPCEHGHMQACYTDELVCGLAEITPETATDSDASHTHTQECYQLDCSHERGVHDEVCGYAEGTTAAPCTHKCELCEVKDSSAALPIITGFAPLDETIHTQRVGADDLVLPETLLATVDCAEKEIPVTWDGLDSVNEARKSGGLFALTANVGEGYTLAEGVTAPTISAMILGMGRGTSGTADDPYVISTVDQLIYLGTLVSQDNPTYNASDKYFKLTADLDLKGQAWTPIGGEMVPFKTHFDGNGHTVKGLTINQPTVDYVGLFGNATGEIKNVMLTKVNVTGKDYVGGVVGNGSTVTNCCVTGTIKGNSRVGGVAGQVDANVLDCYSTGTVTGSVDHIGGVVGHAGKDISSSYSTSTVSGANYVGGVAGQAVGKVSNCATLNKAITASGNVVGRVAGDASTFENCYAFAGTTVSSSTVAGGAVSNKNGADLTKAALRTAIWWEDTAQLPTASWELVDDNTPALKTTGGTLISGQETDLPIYLTQLPAPVSASTKLVNDLNAMQTGTAVVDTATGNVKLLKSITLTGTITIEGDLTLDTQTFTITGKAGVSGNRDGSNGLTITSPAVVTITGGGIIGGKGGNGVQGDVTLSGNVTITGGERGTASDGDGRNGYGVYGNVTLSGSATIIGGGSSGNRVKAVMDAITAGTTDTVILGGNNADSVTTPITSGTTSSYYYIKAQTAYAITKAGTSNGSFTVKVGTNEVTQAAEGDTVTITPTADSGYEVDTVTVTKTGESTAVTVTNNTFTMPAYGVTVSVTFKSNAPTDSFAVKVESTVGGTSSNSFYTITSETSPSTAENQPAYAKAGETVTVTLRTTRYDSGPRAVSLNVAGIPVARSYDNPNQFTFAMPAQAVDLTITFGAKNTVFAKQYYYPTGTAKPPSADGSIAAVVYTSEVLLTGASDAQFSPSNCTIDGYIYKFSNGNDYGTVDTSGTHLVYTPNAAAAGKIISIFIKAYSGGGVSGAIEHKVTVRAVPVPDYNKDASLSALTYQITDGASGSVTLQANQYEYTVELPFGTTVDKAVTLTPTRNDSTATITAQTTGNTTYGTLNGVDSSDIATVTVTAQDPSVIKVYKVSFLIKEPDVPYSVTNKDTGVTYRDGDTITIGTGNTVKLSVNHGCGSGGAGAFHYAVEDTSIVYSAPGAGTGIYPNTMHLVTMEAKKVGNTKFVVQFYAERTTDFVGKTPIDTITLNLVCPDPDIAAVKAAIESVLSNLAVSNVTTMQDILNAATGATSNGVTVAWDSANGFTKIDATADATGSITGTLTLTLNGKTATVAVNKTIPKLAATTYTVTLNPNGGAVSPTSLSVATGDTAALPTPSRSGSYRFDGWFTALSGGTQYTNSTPINSNVTLYARWTYTGGGSGGGSVIVTPPTPDKPNAPTESEIKVPGKVDGNGNATATVTDKAVSDAIKQAEDTARTNGNLENGITLVLNVDTGSKTANTVSVNLPKVTQETIISKKIVSTVLVVNNPDIRIGIDLAAVKEINTQAKADVSISATRMDNAKLTDAAKTAINNRPAFDLKATYQNGAKSVTGFGDGSVSVALPYTMQAGEVAGGLYAVYVDASGKVSYIIESSYDAQNKVLRFATNHFSVYGIGYKAPAAFTDGINHWAKTDIEFVVNRGLMNGTSNTTFSPNGSMTRGMFVTALGRLASIDSTKYTNTKFTDIKADAYYAPYVVWATEKGITVGTSATTFDPDNIVTRQEMAVFMSNYAKAMGYKVPQTREAITFADNSSIGSWAAAEVKQMQMAGVLNGKNSNTFDPTGTATRGEIAAVLRRYVELIIDPTTAQGLDVNDSGSAMLYENGRLVKSQSRTVNSRTYAFNSYGEAALPADIKKYLLHIVKKNQYFYAISRMYGCTQAEIMVLNGLRMGDVIHPGDVLKVPEK